MRGELVAGAGTGAFAMLEGTVDAKADSAKEHALTFRFFDAP